MKKLMIVAAVAAMTVTGFADNYKFTATLKTTAAKQGKEGKTATQNFGYNSASDEYWYENAEFKAGGNFVDLVSTTKKKKGGQTYTIFTIKQADVNKMAVEDQAALQAVLAGYTEKKAGEDYCLKLYFKTPAVCYRAPVTKKFEGLLSCTGDCCAYGTDPEQEASFQSLDFVWLTDKTDKIDIIEAADGSANNVEWKFGYRINTTFDAAKTVEGCLMMSLWTDETADWSDSFGDWGDATEGINYFALAGQGTFDAKNDVIKCFNGKMVGVLPPPQCGCCDHEKDARVYSCTGAEAYDYGTVDSPVNPSVGTAAFGDFSINYKK